MSWAKLDDRFCVHRKIVEVGNAGAGLFVRLLTWSCMMRSNGVVTEKVIASFDDGDASALTSLTSRLVSAGLLERQHDGTYVIHDFGKFNPVASGPASASVSDGVSRSKAAERQARYAARKSAEKSKSTDASVAPSVAPSWSASASVSTDVTDGVALTSARVPLPLPVPLNNPDPPNPPSGGAGIGDGGGDAPSSPPVRRSNRLWDVLATAYAEGIREASGAPFLAPSATHDLRELKTACETHCGSAATIEAQLWLKASAKEYRTATASAAQYQSGFSPTAWAKWLNAGKPKASPPSGSTKQRSDGVDWTQTPKSKAARAELDRRAQEQKAAGITSLLEGIVDT